MTTPEAHNQETKKAGELSHDSPASLSMVLTRDEISLENRI
jgi:hypothetical protein